MKFVTYVISDPKTGVARYVGKGYEKRRIPDFTIHH